MNTEQERIAVEADRQGRMPSDEDLLGCAGVSRQSEGTLPMIVGTADIRRFADCVRKHWGSSQPATSAEPCFCDRMYPDSNPDATCGDCPRDYLPAVSAEPVGPVRLRDEGSEIYLDGIQCRYSIEQGEPWPFSDTLAYAFDPGIAERIVAALNASPVAQEPLMPWRGHWGAIDAKALSTAQEIALMWGADRSQFVSRIQVAVIEAMLWMRDGIAAPVAAQAQPSAQDQKCQTCGGRGWVGGPSYYAPDEGGEPCPDCAQDREDAGMPEWMTCESRGPMVVNSLKHNAERLRRDEKRCRGAYKKAFMGVPCHYLADVYSEAAAVFEARLKVIDAARAAKESP